MKIYIDIYEFNFNITFQIITQNTMDNRRDFIKKASIASAGLMTTNMMNYQSTLKNDKLDRVGIILNTVGNEMKEDYKGTLRKLAEMGYRYVEGGVAGDSASAYRKFLDSIGLKMIATGGSMSGLQDELDKYLKTAEDLKVKYLVTYWPWLSSAENLTKDEVMQTAERLNKVGKKIKEAGFTFAWHNHDKEFRDINGQFAFDMILQNTDPENVTVEMDWYWVVKGGQNPVDYFKKYPGRFELAHVKDMNNNRDGGITCVGNGIMDFKEIFDQAERGGVKYFIVENERAVKGMKCAQESFDHIKMVLS